jgi:hypothetical protein
MTVVIPLTGFTFGANGAMWGSEVRVTNLSQVAKVFHVIDWIGKTANLPFRSQEFSVPPGATQSYGGWTLISAWTGIAVGYPGPLGDAYFGAAVLDIDAELVVQAAILTGGGFAWNGQAGIVGFSQCPAFRGGYYSLAYYISPEPYNGSTTICNDGAGPLIDGTGDFYAAGTPIFLPWLHTDETRRTNLTFYNPDPAPAMVTVAITPADGTSPVSLDVVVPAHDLVQINDVFSHPPFDAVRAANGAGVAYSAMKTAAARATVRSTTRLYAVGWVISNQNNTVTISLPR